MTGKIWQQALGYIAVALVGLALGFYWGRAGYQPVNQPDGSDLVVLPPIIAPGPVSGYVEGMEGDSLMVKVDPPVVGAPAVRAVNIDESTRIFRLAQKDDQQFARELAAFERARAALPEAERAGPILLPPSFTEEDMDRDEIMVGDYVTADPLDAADADNFVAVTIRVSAPIVNTPPTAPADATLLP